MKLFWENLDDDRIIFPKAVTNTRKDKKER